MAADLLEELHQRCFPLNEQPLSQVGTVAIVEPIIQGVMQTSDGYWRVEAVRYSPKAFGFRVFHSTTLVADNAAIATVQHILGDAYATLQPVETDADGVA